MVSSKPNYSEIFRALKAVVSYSPGLLSIIVFANVISAALSALGMSLLIPVIEVVQKGPAAAQGKGDIVQGFLYVYEMLGVPFVLEYLLLGIGLTLIVRHIIGITSGWFTTLLVQNYDRDLKKRSFSKAVKASIPYYDKEGSDTILNSVITQTGQASGTLSTVIGFSQQLLVVIGLFALAVFLAPLLSVLVFLNFLLIMCFSQYLTSSNYELGRRGSEANERIQEKAQQGVQGIREVKLFGMTTEVLKEFYKWIDESREIGLIQAWNSSKLSHSYDVTVNMGLLMFLYLALAVFELSFSVLGVFLFTIFRLAPRVNNLSSTFYGLMGQLPHLIRAQEFLEHADERREPYGEGIPAPEKVEEIVFDEVSFAYERGEEQVLEDISFEIERGEFVAFAGRSGAGKSTIVSLLTRFYSPDSGQIRANDRPIEDYNLEEWRERTAMVRQNPHIFNKTLRFNLKIGNREATDEEMKKAAEIAKVTEFLDELPQGYDTKLGDDGVRLSGGQRQRVAIARALLKGAEVLILDEATSDLDSGLEKEVQEGIESLEQDYTIIAIAHRLSTIENADRIYTLESGRITEVGTHDELLEKDGEYATLYKMQSQNFPYPGEGSGSD